MDKYQWICFISVCLVSEVYADKECIAGIKTPGYTIPSGDIYVEYGKHLSIHCILNDDYIESLNGTSEDMYFVRDGETVSTNVRKYNSESISLYIAKPNKTFSTVYVSKVKANPSFVCFNKVIVGTKPARIKDFKCTSYNLEKLECTWTAPQNYVKTIYHITYIHKYSDAEYKCPQELEGPNVGESYRNMSCFWTIDTTPPYKHEYIDYSFRLHVTNYFGSSSVVHHFIQYEHVIPAPPQDLKEIQLTESSVHLEWKESAPYIAPGFEYQILYQSHFEKKWQRKLITDEGRVVRYNLTNLEYIDSLYNIRVSARYLNSKRLDMWSRYASLTIRTEGRLPEKPPPVTTGSFEIVYPKGSLNQREVTVYWQQLPVNLQNGRNFNYSIEVEDRNDIKPVEIMSNYAKFANLSVSNTYMFHIWSQNYLGRSINNSKVNVPRIKRRIITPHSVSKVYFGDGKYELSWNIDEIPPHYAVPLLSFTVFTCSSEKDRPYQCSGYLNWTEVPSNTRSVNVTVSENTINQFAVSANTDQFSSGMVWSECTIFTNRSVNPIQSFTAKPQYEISVLSMSWELDHTICLESIKGFTISYNLCYNATKTTCSKEKTFDVASSERMLSIENLDMKSDHIHLILSMITTRKTETQKLFVKFRSNNISPSKV